MWQFFAFLKIRNETNLNWQPKTKFHANDCANGHCPLVIKTGSLEHFGNEK